VKLSDGVEWGLHSAAVLAGLPPNALRAGKDLAEFHGVSESYLLKHLKAMVKANLLESVPGPNGGFRLARAADTITFLDVVDAVEGSYRSFVCTEIRQRCPIDAPASFAAPCQIHAAMRQAENAYRNALKERTLGHLAAELTAKLPAARQKAAAEWLTERVRFPAARKERKMK